MCGLVAMISKSKAGFINNDVKLFEQMLYTNALRGMDSTGIFGVNKYGNVKMLKTAKPSAEFIQTKAFSDFKTDIFSKFRVVVGHNRAATRGATTDENAHPFIEGNTCLVHNGTLYNHKHLGDKEVDSHAICEAFSKKDYMEVLPTIHGAFALIWYDANKKKLHIARNEQRPLWLVQTKDADFIASEPTMLIWLIQRVFNTIVTPVYFDTDSIFTYDLDALDKGYTTEAMPKKATPVVTYTSTKHTQATTGKVHKKSKITTTISEIGVASTNKSKLNKGDLLFFTYEKSSIVQGSIKITGRWVGDNKTEVNGYIHASNYSADELEYILESATMFYGKYIGDTRTTKKHVLFTHTAHPVKDYDTLNGTFVSDKQLMDYGHCCDHCGKIINAEEEEGTMWARLGGTSDIKALLCTDCVKAHPYLSNVLEKKECTKPLPSLVTNQDQNPSRNSLMH